MSASTNLHFCGDLDRLTVETHDHRGTLEDKIYLAVEGGPDARVCLSGSFSEVAGLLDRMRTAWLKAFEERTAAILAAAPSEPARFEYADESTHDLATRAFAGEAVR